MPAGEEPRALCLGLVATDFLVHTRFPVPRDLKVPVKGFVRQGGGPAGTAAACLARLGARTSFAGAVGDDELGREQRAELAEEGIDTAGAVTVPGSSSFVCFILVDEADGARTILSAPDTRPLNGPGELALGEPRPHLVLVDGWGGPEQLRLARDAAGEGIPVLLDAGSHRPEILDLLPATEVVIASERFAEAIAPAGDHEAALAWLLGQGPRLAAVTAGERGAWAAAADGVGSFHVPAFPVTVADTTGAGDAFHGGAAWALLAGHPWGESLRIAAAVAALKCRRTGGRAGLPGRKELEAFLASA